MKPAIQELLAQANQGVPPPKLTDNDIDLLAERDAQHHLDSRPIYLPAADKQTIDHELSRLKKPEFRGLPHE